MRTLNTAIFLVITFVISGCGATRSTTPVINAPTLTSASVYFVNRDHGKDKNSTATIQLLRNTAELIGAATVVSTKFDDYSVSSPLALGLSGSFRSNDMDDGELKVRFTPDGRDDWTFDVHLTMRFSDGSIRNFAWTGLRLDNNTLERTLALGPARIS